MFEHSVKVPRHYKIAANIFRKVSTEGGSVKTLLYDDKLRHFRTNVLYALITETIKHTADIEKIFDSSGILTNEPRLDPWLAKILAAELLFGKKALPGKSKPEQTILSYKEQFEKFTPELQDDMTSKVRRPRYVRINTNLLTTSDAIRAFQDEGYKFIRCTSASYDDYLKQIQGLTEYDFTQDYHVKTLFVFAPGTKLHEHDLYFENQIILQDKATAMAVHLLAPPSGSVVLDMCAAPGMKTTQVAAYLRNQGKVYAVERDEMRYKTLCDFVEKTASKCVETFYKDSLEIRRGDFEDVEYIILDPSCSGSGMELSVHKYIETVRLAKLTSLQEKFLKHAMNSFPNAKRIVYSTCSLFPEENERVITNVVKTSRAKWRVQDVNELLKGHWNNFGSGMYGSMGTRCLYAKPESDFTTGFFLAVLDREHRDNDKIHKNDTRNKHKSDLINENEANKSIGNDREIPQEAEKIEEKPKNTKKREKTLNPTNNIKAMKHIERVTDEINDDVSSIKKKEKKKDKFNDTISKTADVNDITEIIRKEPLKKKKRNKDKINETYLETTDNNDESNIKVEEPPKKKKKKKDKDVLSEDNLKNDNFNGQTDLNVVASVESNEITKTKKKKRNKNKDEFSESSSTVIQNSKESETNQNHEIENTLKINKKSKSKSIDDIETNDICVDASDVPNKKNKKHKEISYKT